MSDETLLTAARRAVRFFRIDMEKGGIVTTETEHAINTLDKMVRRAEAQEKRDREGPGADAGIVG